MHPEGKKLAQWEIDSATDADAVFKSGIIDKTQINHL